jgi:hypothetical protein
MWSTFKQSSGSKTLVPGDFSIPTDSITIPNTAPGIEIVPVDITNTVRFANLSLENKAKTNGDPISIFIGIGFIPTTSLYSFEMLSGQQEAGMQINGQQIKAIAESGETLEINVQIANAISKNL